jgi:hypothetical protein
MYSNYTYITQALPGIGSLTHPMLPLITPFYD